MTDSQSAVRELELPGASLSILAVERPSGERVVSATPERALAPASNTKLVTAGLALEHLGPDWQFETRLVGCDSADDGVLDDDIVLVGTGAPDLDTTALSNLATAVGQQVNRVTGDVIVDGSRFPDGKLGPGWTWGDSKYYYGARSSAVALDRNQVTVTVNADDTETGLSVSVSPETEAVELDTAVSIDAGASPDDLQIFADPVSESVTLRGAVSSGSGPVSESVPIQQPERHTGLALRNALADAGVELAGSVTVLDDAAGTASDRPVLGRINSAPIGEIIRDMNVPSDNFIAEQLARTVAHEVTGDGTWTAWETVVEEHFESLDIDTVRIRDGSGLSRYNLIPAEGVIEHLRWADDQHWSEAFFDTLPTPGEGTLSSRLEGVPVAAKTGTITGTSALSGVVQREAAPDVLFSVLYGGLTHEGTDTVRAKQDAFVNSLVDCS